MELGLLMNRFLLVALLCSAVPASAIMVISGVDPNAVIINGNNDFFGTLNLSGVVEVTTDFGNCSGVLVGDSTVLTAGHCMGPNSGSLYNRPQVTFLGPTNTGPFLGGYQTIQVASVSFDPLWNGDPTLGGDLAVVHLAAPAPSYAMRYSLYTGPSIPYGSALVLAGFGVSGTGATGISSAYPYDFLRAGTNVYETNGADPLLGWSPNLLMGQFYDVNNPSTNALGVANPYSSSDEVDIAHGDSGGPTFYNGQVIGIHDLGACLTAQNSSTCLQPPSISSDANLSTYGQLFGDVSVSGNLAFLEGQLVPEPESVILIGIGLVLTGLLRRGRH